MKFICLILSSIVLIFCSYFDLASASEETNTIELEPSSFKNMSFDTLRCVYNFFSSQERVNTRFINSFNYYSMTLKLQVQEVFNIRGLEGIDDNEPELAGVLRMSWTSHDPFLFFAALMEEVSGGKKPYKVLFRPLVLHLLRTFRSFSLVERQKYQNYLNKSNTTFERCLAKICATKGLFDLVFDIARDDSQVLREFVARFENSNVFVELLRVNPRYAYQYLDVLLTDSNSSNNNNWGSIEVRFGQWISVCIINNLPINYYQALFDGNPVVLEFMINHLSQSANVPDYEYPRIHAQIVELFNIYSGVMADTPEFIVLKMINDIRFGFFDFKDFQAVDFDTIDKSLHIKLAKAALLSNKEDLFFVIYKKSGIVLDIIMHSFDKLGVDDFQVNSFKIIIEMIQTDDKIKNFPCVLKFLLKLYAVKGFKYYKTIISLEFVASDHLLALGFPPIIQITKENYRSFLFDDIFMLMKVFDENSIFSFMSDLIEYCKNRSETFLVNPIPIEIMEMISKSSSILGLLLENGKKLHLRSNVETIEKYLTFPNFHLTSKIIEWKSCHFFILPKLKTRAEIEKIVIIQSKSKTVDELFLELISNLIRIDLIKQETVKFHYFELRSIFAYWIKYGNKQSIKKIPYQFSGLMELLKLDFPYETKDIIGD